MIKVGCCGFAETRDKYLRKFNLVEIQQTFFQLPQLKTVARWRSGAGRGFEFTLKAWQLITHPPTSPGYEKLRESLPPRNLKNYGSFQLTSEVLKAWERTEEVARALEARLIVFDCPPDFIAEKTHIDNLTKFFGSVERNGYTMVWDPKATWPEDLVESLCRDLDLVRACDPFVHRPPSGSPWYLRLCGSYSDKDLRDLSSLLADQPEAYVLFGGAQMLSDAERFKKLIR